MAHRFSNTKAQRDHIRERGEAIHAAEQIYRAVQRIKEIVRPIVREVLEETK